MTTSTWVNFAEIRKRVSIEEVLLTYYHLDNLKKEGNKLIGPCPVHSGDSPRAFHVDLDKNVWHCFSKCQGGGNVIDLVAKKENLSIRDAALKLQAFFMSKPAAPVTSEPAASEQTKEKGEPSTSSTEKEDEAARNPPLDIKLELKADHPHLTEDRGLNIETTEHFGIGYCSRGILRGMIAIPIHDDEGELVAYAGRRLKPQDIREYGKYKLPKGFRKELVLYNFHRAKALQKEHGLILVEGFFSVLKLFEAGLPNVIAPMGCELSDQQARLLTEAKEVFILFDGNEAGYTGAVKAKEKLEPLTRVHIARLPQLTEPESFSPQVLRWLVNSFAKLGIDELTFSMRAATPRASTT